MQTSCYFCCTSLHQQQEVTYTQQNVVTAGTATHVVQSQQDTPAASAFGRWVPELPVWAQPLSIAQLAGAWTLDINRRRAVDDIDNLLPHRSTDFEAASASMQACTQDGGDGCVPLLAGAQPTSCDTYNARQVPAAGIRDTGVRSMLQSWLCTPLVLGLASVTQLTRGREQPW